MKTFEKGENETKAEYLRWFYIKLIEILGKASIFITFNKHILHIIFRINMGLSENYCPSKNLATKFSDNGGIHYSIEHFPELYHCFKLI